MSEFPLDIIWPKEDTLERLQALAEVPASQKITAAEYNIIIRALNELNARDVFVKGGKVLYLQHPDNVAEQEPAIKDWALTVTATGLQITQVNAFDQDGNPEFTDGREYEPDI